MYRILWGLGITVSAALLSCSSTVRNSGGAGGEGGAGGTAGSGGSAGGAAAGGGSVCARALAVGTQGACIIDDAQHVRCWGSNQFGALGNDSYRDSLEPVEVEGLGEVDLLVGGESRCARKLDGSVWCWGKNNRGALALGHVTGDACGATTTCISTPQRSLLEDVRQMDLEGGANGCAVKVDGTLWCWGQNQQGQLGIGTLGGPGCDGLCEPTPRQVATLGAEVVEVALGNGFACALKEDGGVWCWGSNALGFLGDGTADGEACNGSFCRTVPVRVIGLPADVRELAGAGCAVDGRGALWCWGSDARGGLGDGPDVAELCTPNDYPCSTTALEVSALGTGVKAATSKAGSTCAIRANDSLWCWGNDFDGQLGDETRGEDCTAKEMNCKNAPQPVSALTNVVRAVGVSSSTCALVGERQEVWCWGGNHAGALGRGYDSQRELTPALATTVCP